MVKEKNEKREYSRMFERKWDDRKNSKTDRKYGKLAKEQKKEKWIVIGLAVKYLESKCN